MHHNTWQATTPVSMVGLEAWTQEKPIALDPAQDSAPQPHDGVAPQGWRCAPSTTGVMLKHVVRMLA